MQAPTWISTAVKKTFSSFLRFLSCDPCTISDRLKVVMVLEPVEGKGEGIWGDTSNLKSTVKSFGEVWVTEAQQIGR